MKVVKRIIGYKTLTDDMCSGHGNGKWKIGEWKKHKGELKLCQSGFHASRHPLDALEYVQGNRLFIVEGKGEIIEEKDKFVIREMKLKAEIKDLKKISVKFSIYCAKRCLPNYEKKYPDDKRVRQAIEAAEAWLKAKTPKEKEAAWSAAWSAVESAASAAWPAASAARSAAWSAAWSAASAARSAAESAASAARSAARSAVESAASAARSAARSAAESAASAAESAAESAASAARSAAWSAVESAASAAESAAWSAVESAASAARSAARSAIKKKFLQIIERETKK